MNTALIQELCLCSFYYTSSIRHIYFLKKATLLISADIVTGTEFNFPLQTIRKLENKHCKTVIPEKGETNYVNSTIILISCLEAICRSLCRKGISSRAKQYHWVEGTEIRVIRGKGSWNLWGRDPEEEAMQRKISRNLHGVPLSMLLKHMVNLHKSSQKNDEQL